MARMERELDAAALCKEPLLRLLWMLAGCARPKTVALLAQQTAPGTAPDPMPFYDAPGAIVPIRADVDRIFRITVCLRPFRRGRSADGCGEDC